MVKRENQERCDDLSKKILPKRLPVKLAPKVLANLCGRIPLLMRDGMSVQEVCLELGIGKTQCALYKAQYADFANALEEGEWLARGWWESLGRRGIQDKSVNASLYQLVMRNRFGWDKELKEKQEGPPPPRIIGLPGIDLDRI